MRICVPHVALHVLRAISKSNRPQILAFHGVKVEDFDSKKQMAAAADELIAENRRDYPDITGDEDKHSSVVPELLSKFNYVYTEGTQ